MPMTAGGLAKLLEEMGELSQVAAKKLVYYDTDVHPDGKGSLKDRLTDEAADVVAALIFVGRKFNFDQQYFDDRVERKLAIYNRWDETVDNDQSSFQPEMGDPK